MDAVKKHKFWILAGLVIPLALAGYFMAAGAMQAAIAERETALDALSPVDGNRPNDTFTEVAAKRANELERMNAQQVQRLDQIQRVWMSWPKLIERGLERHPETNEIVYRGENLVNDSILFQYRDHYAAQMNQLYYFADPVIPSGVGPYQSKNKVFLDPTVLPRHDFPQGQRAEVQQMWDAQEDYWILKMLLTAINETNLAAEDVRQSAIREISYIELFGGSGESTVVAAPASGGEMEGGFDPSMYAESSAGAGPQVQFANGAIAFDPAEEYGSASLAPAGGDGSGGEMYADAAFGGAQTTGPTEHRYIKFDEANPGPYRERGFYLSVLISEKKIPDLLVNLANLDPPIRTGRWAFANNPLDDDHLLRAPALAAGGGGRGSADLYNDGGSIGAGGGRPTRRPTRGASSDYEEYGSGGRMNAGSDPTMGNVRLTQAQQLEMDEWRDALQSKDLVQLELTGVVTIFTPEVPVTPEEPAAEEGAAPESPDAAATPEDPQTPEAPLDPNAPPSPEDIDPATAPRAADPSANEAPAATPGDPAAVPTSPMDPTGEAPQSPAPSALPQAPQSPTPLEAPQSPAAEQPPPAAEPTAPEPAATESPQPPAGT